MRKLNYSLLAAIVLLAIAGTGCTAKVKAAYHLKRAEKYYAAGELGPAEIEYKNALRNAPENAHAWSQLGLIFFDEGRVGEALPVLVRAEQLDPNNFEVRLKLGGIYLAQGKIKEARDEANYVLARKPQDEQSPLLLADTVTTNDWQVCYSQLKQMQQKGDSASLQVALGTLAFHKMDLKTAEANYNRAITLNPKFSDAYLALGNLYVAQKDIKRADAAYQKAMELAPVASGNGVRYAQFKILTGDSKAGEQLLRDIVKTNPDFLPAWMTLVQLAAAKNDFTNSLALLDNVLSRDPQNFDGLLLQGQLQLSEGKATDAIQSFERMSSMYPQVSAVHYALAQAYLVNNQTNEANTSLVQALNLNPKNTDAILLLAEMQIRNGNTSPAIVSLRQLVQQQPQNVQGWLLLAEAYREQGSINGAVQIYRQLESSYPKSPQVPLLLGIAFLQQKQNASARAEFEKSLRIDPAYLPALAQLVDLDLAEKQYSAALQRIQQAAAENPKQSVLQLLLGKAFVAQGSTNQAETALSKAITLQPNSQAAYLMLAQIYAVSGEKQKALDNLQTVLANDPKNVTALMLVAIIYDSANDYEKARDAYEKVLEVSPDNGIVLNNLACLYADHFNQLDKAYPLARHAHDVAPSDPSVADTLGWILYRRGEYAPALELLRQSASRLGAMPEIQFHLGMVAYMTGNEAEASAAFQRALQLAGNFPEKDECRQRLAILQIDAAKAGADTRAMLEKWMVNHPDDPVALVRLAFIYQFNGMPDKAIAAYESILKSNPQNATALLNLARLYAPTDKAKAYADARAAYQLAPSDPEVAQFAGHLAFLNGDYSHALTMLQLAAQSQSQNPEVLFDLGRAFYSMGKIAEAKTAMENALQIQPSFADANNARQFLQMIALADAPAQALAAQNQVADILKATPDYVPALMVKAAIASQKADATTAQKIYEDILNQYPDFAPAQKQLAILYASNPANDAKAYPLAVKARIAFPSDATVAKILGILICRQGDYSRAESLLQESAQQMTPDSQSLYYLGVAQYHLKRNAESKAALQKALAMNLPDEQAADAKRMLAEIK